MDKKERSGSDYARMTSVIGQSETSYLLPRVYAVVVFIFKR
jgi:hypothetical protein